MDLGKGKGKGKKGLIVKTWERCRSLRGGGGSKKPSLPTKSKSWPGIPLPKSRSWPAGRVESVQVDDKTLKTSSRSRVTPQGCFSVYVGPEKQRFVVRTEYVNHPLFKMLLEEAESEYGYNCEGPLTLPCNVDLFYRILSEMEIDGDKDDDQVHQAGCNFTKGYSPYRLLSPARMVAMEY